MVTEGLFHHGSNDKVILLFFERYDTLAKGYNVKHETVFL